MSDIAAELEQLNYAAPAFFCHTLDWQLKLIQRYPEPGFAVIAIAVRSGRQADSSLMIKLSKAANALMRTTDLCTRNEANIFWLILPHTSSAGAELYLRRLAHAWESFNGKPDFFSEFVATTFGSDDATVEADGQRLMAILSDRLMKESESTTN